MRKKSKDSKVNIALTALLVVFVCLLSFSIGVISGKGWSDRDYKVRHIESDAHLKQAQEDTAPIGDDMTEKEVELLTEKAMQEARAAAPTTEIKVEEEEKPEPAGTDASTASLDQSNPEVEKSEEGEIAAVEKKVAGDKKGVVQKTENRQVSSLMPKPTTPKPTSIEYTVQVASYKTMDEAERHSQKLIDKGFPAFPVKTTINDQVWYRVSIGSFKNRKQAVQYQNDLKKQAVVTNSFVQKVQRN